MNGDTSRSFEISFVTKLTSWLIIALLLLQSGLSAVVIYRLQEIRRHVTGPAATNQMSSLTDVLEKVATIQVSDDDPVRGNPDALVTIVEFGNYDCGYCKESVDLMQEILTRYPDNVRLVYKSFATQPQSVRAAEAALCAHEQGKFWEMHDRLFEENALRSEEAYIVFARDLHLDVAEFSACLRESRYAEKVLSERVEGERWGVLGTPTFFVNGYKIEG